MSQSLFFGGARLELLASGLLWLPETRLLCVSDIHFEKGSFFQRFATFLPPYDTRVNLERLKQAIALFEPRILVSLGDSFHDAHALARMHGEDGETLLGLIGSVQEWVWVEGNHDPSLRGTIPGLHCDQYQCGPIVFRHVLEPESEDWEISGHYHPKARISLRGHAIRSACFVHSRKRLIMPAFGSYTGGLDVDHPEFLKVISAERRLYLLSQGKVVVW